MYAMLARLRGRGRGYNKTANWLDVPDSVVGELPRCLRAQEWCVPEAPISSDDALDLHTQRAVLARAIGAELKLRGAG